MKVLVACEFSGVVRDAFIAAGHDAISCDLLESESPGPHIVGDIRELDLSGYDLMIAHPPCTYLCNSGVRWLYEMPGRFSLMDKAVELFRWLLDAPVNRIAVENPVMHGFATDGIGRKHDQIIQPWQFGHGESKGTALWLKNLPMLKPTNVVSGRLGRVHFESPGKDRWKRRSVTYPGIAAAMAAQWGGCDSDSA